MSGPQLLGKGNTVGQDKPAFCIGIQDLDGFAGHGGLDIAGLLEFSADHVFGGGYDANYLNVWFQGGYGAHNSEHGSPSSHVVFHFFHALGGLDGDAASIKGYGLTN